MCAGRISEKFLGDVRCFECWLVEFYQLDIEFKVVKIDNINKKCRMIVRVLVKSWVLIEKHRKSHIK